MTMRFLLSLAFASLLPAQILYVGTYTNATTKGIYAYKFDAKTGGMEPMGVMAETASPSFLALHPNGKFLYAVNELQTYQGKPGGSVTSFSIDRTTGKLTKINEVASRGSAPCHIAIDKTGKVALVANYFGGNFTSYQIKADGSLSEPVSVIQDAGPKANRGGPHAHEVVVTADNKFALAADLGLDKVQIFKFDPATAVLTANDPASGDVDAGSGPRHIVLSKDQKWAFVINEISSTVTSFKFDAQKGALTKSSVVTTLPADFKGTSTTAEIMIDAANKFIYASNRGHDSIAVLSVDAKTGVLKPVSNTSTGGKTPRNFNIDPTGKFLIAANQDSGNIVVFKIDPATGKLTPSGTDVKLGSPVCLVFLK